MIAFLLTNDGLFGQLSEIRLRAQGHVRMQEWSMAEHEYGRLIFYGGSLQNPADYMALADCQVVLGHLDEAIKNYRQTYRLAGKSSAFRDTSAIRGAFAAMLADRHGEALGLLSEHRSLWSSSSLKREAAVLESMLYNYAGDFEKAHTLLVETYSDDAQLVNALDSLYAKPLKFKPKKQVVALALSLIPGVGQAYTGVPGEGVLSLGLAGGMATLGVFSFIQGHYFFAILTCLPQFQKLYEGGARYAMKRANQWNENRRTELATGLNDYLIGTLGGK